VSCRHGRVCGLLAPLAALSDTNRTQIITAGGTVVIITAMQSFPEDSGVQSFCCGALANLAHNDGGWSLL
jgi:hypothetical protein